MELDCDYERLLSGNREYIGTRMNKSRLSFGNDHALMSAEELIRQQHICEAFSPILLEKLYDMGRFFQITDTGDLPPYKGQHKINTICRYARVTYGPMEEMVYT
jgi:hypothetical protein